MTQQERERAERDSDIHFEGRQLPKLESEVDAFNATELEEMKQRGFIPGAVHVQVSKRCNLQCVMCSWHTWKSNVGLMEEVVFERILSECKRTGVRKIVFGNAQGEPFLHPKILDMLERSVELGFWTMVSTNGTPLTPQRIKRLANCGVQGIQFSFAGYNKAVYETVYAGAKWEIVTRNLQQLSQALAESTANTRMVVHGCYATELEKVIQPNAFIAKTRAFLNSIGVAEPDQQILIQLPHNFGGSIEAGDVGSGAVKSNFEIPTRKPGLCRVLKNQPGIYFDGKMTACGCLDPNGDLPIGDIKETSLESIRNGQPFQSILNTFLSGELEKLPLCAGCDVPYYENPRESPRLWQNRVQEWPEPAKDSHTARRLDLQYHQALERVLQLTAAKLDPAPAHEAAFVSDLIGQVKDLGHLKLEVAHAVSHKLFTTFANDKILEEVTQRPIRKIGLAPATKIVLEHLDWFQKRYDEVYVADNHKNGECHSGQEVLTLDALLEKAPEIDVFLLTTNTAEIEAIYREILPVDKTISISDLCHPMHLRQFTRSGRARAERIIEEIEASEKPLVVLGTKLLATCEPTFAALENEGYDVFVISLYDKMENRERSDYDPDCAVTRNALVSPYEQLYILTTLRKGLFWIYYDFFYYTAWDASRCLVTYANAAAMCELAHQPVVLAMYDIIKPIRSNMDRRHEAFALYKVMLDLADAVALTSKSEHIAEYLRNTLVKDRPVVSFYRYSIPPKAPRKRLSAADGERHLVGITSFFGEVYEPSRIAPRDSIRSILRQKHHFHYYSDNQKVFDFREALPADERAYFHIEPAIWDQRELVHALSCYDGGWLVGDEAAIFANLICQVEDLHIRELYTLFVPNGVPTSSMTYGSAGLPVFINRQIKVMDEVYPKGCCIPMDMGEVDNLSQIFKRLDWEKIHQTMREKRHRFDAFHQIPRLAAFLDTVRKPHETKEGTVR